jgi:hypothetical protein
MPTFFRSLENQRILGEFLNLVIEESIRFDILQKYDFLGDFLSVWIGNPDSLHLINYPKKQTKSVGAIRFYTATLNVKTHENDNNKKGGYPGIH